jgi:uncharacterized protein (DUF58 family)
LFLSVRRSMTGASATLLVIGIVTLNIIWGYPWVGMFSACVSLLLIGWAINRITRPKLAFQFTLPRSAPAGQPVSVSLHGRNEGRLPAMDVTVELYEPRPQRWKKSWDTAGKPNVLSSPHRVNLIESGERFGLTSSVQYERRGVQALPDVRITSSFPFHLFRSTRQQPSQVEIAITPRLLTGDEDSVARGMLDALGGWSHKLLSGDALDYTGSREYQTGMPVRRWDFTSWARLGRPIVREFQSPSIQLVSLIVDTSVERPRSGAVDPLLERLLSLAATAVTSLAQRLVRVQLFLTSEATTTYFATTSAVTPSDSESMLIRLADASGVSTEIAEARIERALEQIGRSPTMLLTTRPDVQLPHGRSSAITLLRVDPPPSDGGDGRGKVDHGRRISSTSARSAKSSW